MKIVSWQSVLTDHQSHTLRALQEVAGEPVLIISGVKELKERQAQGWTAPDVSGLHVHYLPSTGWWRNGVSILREYPDATHLFNGLWADRRFFPLLLEAQRREIRTGLVTEPYSEIAVGYLNEEVAIKSRIKAMARPWLYRMAGKLVAKKLDVVFTISEKAERQFSAIGVRKECIFPFGYFVPAMQAETSKELERNGGVKLVFVGSLIQRKGIHILVEAMKLCARKELDIALDVFGPGDAESLSATESIHYKGVLPFGQAQKTIARYDVLVLPSQHDGWGVVVNEALLQGVPVIVSDQVGAKALVEKSGAGSVVKADDASALAACLEGIALHADRLRVWKDAAASFREYLTPEVAARYMYGCVRYALKLQSKPKNTWYII